MDVEVQHHALDALAPQWRELFGRDPEATPFAHPDWARACWRHRHDGAELWLITVRDAGELAGLAPLVLRRTGPFRVLRVLGEEVSDYWHVLSSPDRREAVIDAVAKELHRRRSEWDVLVMTRLAPGSELPDRLADAGLGVHPGQPESYPQLELPDTFDAYLARLPATRRQNLRRHLRRLDAGEVQLLKIEHSDVGAAVPRWHALRRDQWEGSAKALEPMHTTAGFESFMIEAVASLVDSGLCSFWEFRRGDELIGSYINFVDDRAFYWYLGGFKRSASRYGIGKIAAGHGIRSSIEAGRRQYDFMRGDEEYKYWFGATERLSRPYRVTSNTIRSFVADRARRLARRR